MTFFYPTSGSPLHEEGKWASSFCIQVPFHNWNCEKIFLILYYSRMKYYKILMLPSWKSALGYLWTIYMLKCLQNKHSFPSNHSALRKVGQTQAKDNAVMRLEKQVSSLCLHPLGLPKRAPDFFPFFCMVSLFLICMDYGAQIQCPRTYQNTIERGLAPRTIISFSFKNIRFSLPCYTSTKHLKAMLSSFNRAARDIMIR
ncbi:hypothetical protein HJG60_009770 [Phyllostomus discolor]|uniref:Uncharacterized protein n=1 Tax=Phyllostomus discolor TaxID=89673 RepID=A0A834B6R2_9CHIR|nr:hypothetical protein HJG60_009770 [Phyllostomus discolor]